MTGNGASESLVELESLRLHPEDLGCQNLNHGEKTRYHLPLDTTDERTIY
jgi:hypothetical protein